MDALADQGKTLQELSKYTKKLKKTRASKESVKELRGEVEKMKAFDRLKSEFLRYEARLRKASDREKSLKLLCERKESELARVDAQVAAKESALAKASSFEMQIQTARANDSARVNMIARLESKLSKARVEVVNA
ncbi:uncharacterized protein [Nicotiana sylvestris]|uniref:uncharacterized protein n=1 Tax=Nicotiana sylvestris TaxID=4096 RepID=UPI00388CCA41